MFTVTFEQFNASFNCWINKIKAAECWQIKNNVDKNITWKCLSKYESMTRKITLDIISKLKKSVAKLHILYKIRLTRCTT